MINVMTVKQNRENINFFFARQNIAHTQIT